MNDIASIPEILEDIVARGITSIAPKMHDNQWPAWFCDEQQKAWNLFQSLPEPRREHEAWRFANLKALDLSSFHATTSIKNADLIIERSIDHPELAAKLVFANQQLIENKQEGLVADVLLLPLEKAARDHEALFRKAFIFSENRLGSKKFVALHIASLRTGALLYIPPGIAIEKPIEIWHWVDGENVAIFPHTLIVMGEGSSATLIERFVSLHHERSCSIAVNNLLLEENARLHYVALHEWSDQTTAFHLNTTTVKKNATATVLQMNLGGGYIREETESHLIGERASSLMLSMNLAKGSQEIDQRTFQNHCAPSATSDLLYHNALDGCARAIFSGIIKVEEDANETDAYQKVRNLMLSDGAESNSMPGLEILANHVRCTHGATSCDINKEELFYMMTRGIKPHQAKALIVRGFLGTILERLKKQSLQDYLATILDRKMHLHAHNNVES